MYKRNKNKLNTGGRETEHEHVEGKRQPVAQTTRLPTTCWFKFTSESVSVFQDSVRRHVID